MQHVVTIAACAEYFLSLDYFGGQTVAMHCDVLTRARFDELWANLQLSKVAFFFPCVSAEHFYEIGDRSLRQAVDVVRPCENWPVSLA